jgi:hypothetical protein
MDSHPWPPAWATDEESERMISARQRACSRTGDGDCPYGAPRACGGRGFLRRVSAQILLQVRHQARSGCLRLRQLILDVPHDIGQDT